MPVYNFRFWVLSLVENGPICIFIREIRNPPPSARFSALLMVSEKGHSDRLGWKAVAENVPVNEGEWMQSAEKEERERRMRM